MSKDVQQVGGARESQDSLVGLDRQITVDTSNWELRLHDGVTPGGYRILNLDSLLAIFQPKSDELSGFDFDSQAVGLLARLAPQDYRLRSLTVDSTGLSIVNPQGIAGNPLVALNATITGTREFTDGIIADITGDTAGTHVGPVLGNTTGTHIGPVTGNAAGNHTGTFFGDLDIRGKVFQADPGQIPISFVNQAQLLAYVRANAEPQFTIKLWYGTLATIPTGWFLCDGTNGTPNMAGKFARGVLVDAGVGVAAGADSHIHGITVTPALDHVHGVTVDPHTLTLGQMPAHDHGSGVCDGGAGQFNHGTIPASPASPDSVETNGSAGTLEALTTMAGSGLPHSHTGSSTAAGAHTHTAVNDSQPNIPANVGFMFIMKGA